MSSFLIFFIPNLGNSKLISIHNKLNWMQEKEGKEKVTSDKQI